MKNELKKLRAEVNELKARLDDLNFIVKEMYESRPVDLVVRTYSATKYV